MSQFIEIPLTQGKTALIDIEDFDLISQWKWRLVSGRGNRTNYAKRTLSVKGKKKVVLMHRFILNAPKGIQVDHINGNGLDNRKSNLRLATASQNSINRISKNRTGYRGVKSAKGKYTARITCKGKVYFLGIFSSAEAAAQAYDKKAIELHGDFAVLNFPGGEK